MSEPSARVFMRRIPKQFRGDGFTFSRNNIYNKESGTLVGQLEEAGELTVHPTDVTRLFGGTASFQNLLRLSNIANVTSIINLGVSVASFMHISRKLEQVQRRLNEIEGKLDTMHELMGVIDQKIDQLSTLTAVQIQTLAGLCDFASSTQMAKVHQALETIKLRTELHNAKRFDATVFSAIETLHQQRLWFAKQRNNLDLDTAIPLRAEIMRAEVLISMAEAQARCGIDDAKFAARTLESSVESMHAQVRQMWESVDRRYGVQALFASSTTTALEWLEIHSWLHGVNTKTSAGQMLESMAASCKKIRDDEATIVRGADLGEEWKRAALRLEIQDVIGFDLMIKEAGGFGGDAEIGFSIDEDKIERIRKLLSDYERNALVETIRSVLNEHDPKTLVDCEDESGVMHRIDKIFSDLDAEVTVERADNKSYNEEADVESLALCYRLSRNLEAALAFCSVLELSGDAGRQLLCAADDSEEDVLVLELESSNDNQGMEEEV